MVQQDVQSGWLASIGVTYYTKCVNCNLLGLGGLGALADLKARSYNYSLTVVMPRPSFYPSYQYLTLLISIETNYSVFMPCLKTKAFDLKSKQN